MAGEYEASPAKIRGVFAENLRLLLVASSPISEVCREIRINRSQFHRYLNGEAFPKPDVLHRICQVFKTDARILTEPLAAFNVPSAPVESNRLMSLHPEMADYLLVGDDPADTTVMPVGFYRFYRHSFIRPDLLQVGVMLVYEKGGRKFTRGYMIRDVAKIFGINPGRGIDREYRGMVVGNERGVTITASHWQSKSCSFTYLDRVDYVEKSFLFGYCARTMPETTRVFPVCKAIYEYIPNDTRRILAAARESRLLKPHELPELYKEFLLSSKELDTVNCTVPR